MTDLDLIPFLFDESMRLLSSWFVSHHRRHAVYAILFFTQQPQDFNQTGVGAYRIRPEVSENEMVTPNNSKISIEEV